MTRKSLNGFARDSKGAAAIEFALIAPILLSLLFSVFEGGWIMTQSIMLDRAFSTSTRALQISADSITYEQFKANICAEALILRDCAHSLRVELTPINTADDFPTSSTPCVDRRVTIDPVKTYNGGQRSQLVFARACYVVDPLVPGIGLGLALPKDETGGIRLTSSFAFVNEPG